MATIEVDFEVLKALMNKRPTENVSYNDVLRQMLNLGARVAKVTVETGECVLRGVRFPNGTQFRATYKGRTYYAEIKNGEWTGQDGVSHQSPSEAAYSITRNSVNGWRFWEAKRPGEEWRLLSDFRD